MSKKEKLTYRSYYIRTEYTTYSSWEHLFKTLMEDNEPELGNVVSLNFRIDASSTCGSSIDTELHLDVTYSRPETDLEEAERKANELMVKNLNDQINAEVQKSLDKFREKEYKKLKKRFES